MKSQLLKDHFCLFSFPFACTRDLILFLLLSVVLSMGKILGEDLFHLSFLIYWPFLSLLLSIPFFSFPFLFVIDFSYQIIYYSVIHLYLFYTGSWIQFCSPKIAPWRGGDEKNKKCTIRALVPKPDWSWESHEVL